MDVFNDLNDENIIYAVDNVLSNSNASIQIDKSNILISLQQIKVYRDLSKDSSQFIRKFNGFVAYDTKSKKTYIFEGDTCLNSIKIPIKIKKSFQEILA